MTAHPAWCDNAHTDRGDHRGVIGRTSVGGKRVTVVILQTADGPPSVMLSGPMVMQVDVLDLEDMAELMVLASQPGLATLVMLASKTLKDARAEVV